MPRRISDYPDAFTGWNFISSIGSIISVAATALFLHIVYLQLVKGKAVFGYPWAVPQLFSDYLRILKDKCAPGLEWALHSPPKPHAFTSLPLQSSAPSNRDVVISTISGQINAYGDSAANVPSGSDMADQSEGNLYKLPAVKSNLESQSQDTYNAIASSIRNSNLVHEEKQCLTNALNDSKTAVKSAIDESADVAKDLCDNVDESMIPVLMLTGRPVFTILSVFASLYLNKSVNYFLCTYYNIHKQKLNLIFVSLGLIMFLVLYYSPFISCDAPRAWGLYFQDSASPQMEALVELHDNIMYYLVAILFSVGWIQGSIIRNFDSSKSPISNKYLTHGTLIELIWTITPALILVLIAFPSFKLLYLMDEVTDPSLSVLAEGHQWYWSYEYPDFLNSDGDFVEFDSYLVPESDLEEGALRMLEVDNRVIIPEITHTRFILTAADVIHSFAVPALGIKCDAYPGRLNQFSVLINRLGTFYGQCSEICGILHSSMPIVIESVSLEKFLSWLQEQ